MNPIPGIQSALHPQGPHADAIAALAWVLICAAAVILVVVMLLAAYALWGPSGRRAWAAGQRFVVAGGIVFPAVTLTALLVYTLLVEQVLFASEPPAVRIAVTGYQWWWRVQYLDDKGAIDFVTANELRIPAGRPVELTLESADVIHSFGVPNLAGKLDMIPGRKARMTLEAHRPGTFRGQCVEYCGGPHAKMAFYVIAEEPEAFERWRTNQRAPAHAAQDAAAARGRTLFLGHCIACHTVRGTAANGLLGPDLTHVASRSSLAAGVLPMNRGALAGWIAGSQAIKPGNLMPSMNIFPGEDLQALAAYLESLR